MLWPGPWIHQGHAEYLAPIETSGCDPSPSVRIVRCSELPLVSIYQLWICAYECFGQVAETEDIGFGLVQRLEVWGGVQLLVQEFSILHRPLQ